MGTVYGNINIPTELAQAASIVETMTLWAFVQAPGIVMLCKGKIFRVLGFLFLLAAEILFIIVPILAQLGYGLGNDPGLADIATTLYTSYAFYVLTLILAVLETFTLCCCGGGD